jgi:hypothetical protein
MPDPSFGRHGRSEMKRNLADVEAQRVADAAFVVAARRKFLRMDDAAVDPSLLGGAQAVFLRGTGWRFVERVNASTVTVQALYGGTERVALSRVVDYR